MSFKYEQKGAVPGEFVSYSDKRIYSEDSGYNHELQKLGGGRYIKKYKFNLDAVKDVLTMVGLKTAISMMEKIQIGNDMMTITIKTPPELKEYIEFKEVLKCRQKGSKVEYKLLVNGKIKCNPLIKETVKNIYISARVSDIESGIQKTLPPEIDGYMIPQ